MSVAVYEVCNDGHIQNLLNISADKYVYQHYSAQQSLPVPGDSQIQLSKADGIADIPDLLLWSKIGGVALKARHRRGREH